MPSRTARPHVRFVPMVMRWADGGTGAKAPASLKGRGEDPDGLGEAADRDRWGDNLTVGRG